MRPFTLLIGLLPFAAAVPMTAAGQVGDDHAFDMVAAIADHSDHAELHEPGTAQPGVALAAAETIGLDDDAMALCQAAELAMTLGLLTDSTDIEERIAWFRRAEDYARQARVLEPADPEPIFLEAAALGLRADHLGLHARIDAGNRVLEMSDAILALDPDHAGGLHIRGRLNASAMRLPGMVRFVVSRALGGDVLRHASWETAEANLSRALEAQPENPIFHMELAIMLRDSGQMEEARDRFLRILELGGSDALTHHYRERARAALAKLD